jgi:hypothetical protein
MSTPTDNFQTNTHSKKAHQKEGSRRALQFIGGVSRPDSCVQVRQTTKQVVVQRFGLTSDRKTAPRPPSPPPKSTKLHFSHARPCFSGHTISHQVEGHVKTRQQTSCAQFCALERAQQRAQEAKRACLGGPARQACPLFAWRGNFTVVARKWLKDTKSTHRARGRFFLRTAEGPY